MVYALYFSCIIYNVFLITARKKSNVIIILTLISMILIFSWNIGSYDNVNYILQYNHVKLGIYPSKNFEFGFTDLMELSNRLGLGWVGFRFMMACLCIPLIHSTVKQYSSNPHFVYFFYLLHSFFIDAEQLRNFIALSIFIYGIRYLLKEDIKSKLLYVIIVLIASTIHNSYVVYIPLVFIKLYDRNKIIKVVVCFSFLICLLTYLNGNQIPMIGDIFENIMNGDAKVDKYLFESHTRYGFLIPFFLHSFNFLIVYLARKFLKTNNLNIKKNQKDFVELIFWINVCIFVFFPAFMLNVTFYRFTRNLHILNFIAIYISNSSMRMKYHEKVVLNFLLICDVFIWFYYDLFIRANEVLIPIFQQNYLNQ